MSMTRNKPVYVSFYTIDTPYEEEAKELEKTLLQFDLPYQFYARETKGSWEENTQLKAEVIAEALREFCPEPIVFLDADARVLNDPILLDHIDAELAFHHFRNFEVLSGTLYFKNTDVCLDLVDEWIEENYRNKGMWDQKVLESVIYRTPIKWFNLPEEYCFVDKLSKTKNAPVIYHTQVSRRLRRVINS